MAFPPAPDLAGEHNRYRALARLTYNVAWEPHVLFAIIFWIVGEPFLAILNVFSIVALLTARALDRRGHEQVAFWLAIGEISAHAVAATVVLGLGSGFEFEFLLVNVAIVIGGMGAALVQLASVVQRAESALADAYARSESLLLNVLPAPIVARLKERPGLVADRYPEATIMFADIVGFTPMSARVPPDRLVLLLDDLNRTFDDLIDGLGLEKIKTIGDAYMVAGGVPTPRDDHAETVAELALAMHDAVAACHDDEGTPLRLRIGIASGPVVAGVIGQRKFSYDLWGDTVNTAARVESHGVPGATHVTPDTSERLKDRYPFTSRGTIQIKGKGLMQTYLPGSSQGEAVFRR